MVKATVFDVAELAGVSIKTVSRVVNREPNVRAVTQERVDRAITALNYLPNEAARLLAGKRTLKSLSGASSPRQLRPNLNPRFAIET